MVILIGAGDTLPLMTLLDVNVSIIYTPDNDFQYFSNQRRA